MISNKILIIDKHRFGNLTDSYKWCEHLSKLGYDVSIVCFESENNIRKIDNVTVFEVPILKNKFLRGLAFIFISLFQILKFKGFIFVIYFENCKIYKLLFKNRKIHLDIRTLSVSPDEETRKKFNLNLINTCKLYDTISVISEGIKLSINLPDKNIYILPLGSDIISLSPKNYSSIRLLYVGTLTNRNIEDTIEGLAMYIKKNNNSFNIKYDIVGDGYYNEIEKLKALTNKLKLQDIVTFHGRVQHSNLEYFFNNCNIGISYVPITDYFENQPPTKTFEYVLSGLFTIATETNANKEVISNLENGFLITDNSAAFCSALEYISLNLTNLKEEQIRNSLSKYSWRNIVKNYLIPIIQNN